MPAHVLLTSSWGIWVRVPSRYLQWYWNIFELWTINSFSILTSLPPSNLFSKGEGTFDYSSTKETLFKDCLTNFFCSSTFYKLISYSSVKLTHCRGCKIYCWFTKYTGTIKHLYTLKLILKNTKFCFSSKGSPRFNLSSISSKTKGIWYWGCRDIVYI